MTRRTARPTVLKNSFLATWMTVVALATMQSKGVSAASVTIARNDTVMINISLSESSLNVDRDNLRWHFDGPGNQWSENHDSTVMSNEAVKYVGEHPFETLARERMRRGLSTTEQHEPHGRQLQHDASDDYQPMRIRLDTEDLKTSLEAKGRGAHADFIRNELLPDIANLWSNALKVYPTQELKFNQQACGAKGTVKNVDLFVFVMADLPDMCAPRANGNRALAVAGNCQTDQYDRPTVGFTVICTETIELDDEESRRRAMATVAHEFTHILGFTSFNVPYFYDRLTGLPRTSPRKKEQVRCVTGATRNVVAPSANTMKLSYTKRGVPHYELITPTVANVARNQFGCGNMEGARFENQPTMSNDCFGSHWDHRLFGSEYMSALAANYQQVLSPLTLAYLEDTGWYIADYGVSNLSPFGHAAGCDFVYEDCIVHGKVPNYAQGVFCTPEQATGCGPAHRKVAFCDDHVYTKSLPSEFQYFDDPKLGGSLSQFDYCPTYFGTLVRDLKTDSLYEIDCSNPELKDAHFAQSFESFGSDSRCFETSWARPVCLQHRCDAEDHAVDIIVRGETFRCEYDGQEFRLAGSSEVVRCPRLAAICPELICPSNCSGRGWCNYSLKNPVCECFDPSDSSASCVNSPIVPPTDMPSFHDVDNRPPSSAPPPTFDRASSDANKSTPLRWCGLMGVIMSVVLMLI